MIELQDHRMTQVFLFTGTAEGRRLTRRLGAAEIVTTVSVASEYGTVVPEDPSPGSSVTILYGTMTREEMTEAIRKAAPKIVVDATHPYALRASEKIRAASEAAGIPCLRLKRKSKDAPDKKVFLFDNLPEVISALQRTTGNILVTTGIDTLRLFADAEGLKDRVYVRIQPDRNELERCEAMGFSGRQIIAMRGPFSQELNRATIHDYEIRHLITWQSDSSGGFTEKMFAARETETAVYVIGEQGKEGIPYAELLDRLGELLETDLRDTVTINVSLVGVGPGEGGDMTREAGRAIREADILFGEKRLVQPYQAEKKVFPYDRGEDILPRLEQLLQEARQGDPHVRAAVLLPGDTGFHSGSVGLIFYLTNWRRRMSLSDTGKFKMQIRTYPGISSIQLMAARLQDHWDTAFVSGIHGSEDESTREVLRRLPYEKRTYLVTSGVSDVEFLRNWVLEHDPERRRYSLYAGYQLSYPEERIFAEEGERPGIGVEDAVLDPFPDILPEGRYTVMIRNSDPLESEDDRKKQVLAGIPNEEYFQKKGIPITKEEVRTIALGKLRITEPAVVYDIGSGTGSFAVELGRILRESEIYAVEKDPERAELIRKNVEHLSAHAVEVVEGEAPEVLDALRKPTHILIRGSGGKLFLILQELFRKSPEARVVIHAASAAEKKELAQILSRSIPTEYDILDAEYLELEVSHGRKHGVRSAVGRGDNSEAILSFRFARRPGA